MITGAPTMSAFHSACRVPLNLSTQGEMISQTPATIFTHSSQGSALARAAIDKTAITIATMQAFQAATLAPPLPVAKPSTHGETKSHTAKHEVKPILPLI